MNTSGGEVVTIFIGQAGVQVGNACWELFCLEHDVSPDGVLNCCNSDDSCETFFFPTQTGKLTPRTVMIDLDPYVVNDVRVGEYKNLFSPETLISGKEDASSNFARGFYSIGQEAIGVTLDRIRKVCESCHKLRGFMVFRSFGGGTGSGFTALLLERLSEEYAKKTKIDFAIYPAPNISTVIVEPYNAVFTTHSTLDFEDCCIVVDNEALFDISAINLDQRSPTYKNLNRIEAQVVSGITTSFRFQGNPNMSFDELKTNIIPYQRIHFPVVTYSPLTSPAKAPYMDLSVQKITLDCFEVNNQLVKCDPRMGHYLSCVLLYRGDVNSGDVNSAIASLKDKSSIKFVDWMPTGFKIGINYQPVITVPGGDIARTNAAIVMLANNTGIKHAWTRLVRKFNMMYRKKAFVHHYLGEGMEENVFKDAKENIMALVEDFEEVEK